MSGFYLFQIALVSGLFFLLAKLGLTISFIQSNITLFWLPAGFSVTILFLFGFSYLPGIAIGSFLANLSTGSPISFNFIASIANVLEPSISVLILQRYLGISRSLHKLKDIVLFIIFAVILAPIPSAMIGASALCMNEMLAWEHFFDASFSWWAGDAFGVLTLGTLLLVWTSNLKLSIKFTKILEACLCLALLTITQTFIYFDLFTFLTLKYFTWFIFPLLIWASINFCPKVSITFAVIAILIAVIGTINQHGPFFTGNIKSSLILLYSFISIVMINTMVLATTTNERREKENTIENLYKERDAILNSTNDLIWSVDTNFNLLSANSAFLQRATILSGKALRPGDCVLQKDSFSQNVVEFWENLYRKGFLGETVKLEFISMANNSPNTRWMDLNLNPIVRDDKIIGVACFCEDITERKRYEKEIIQAKEEVEIANNTKSEFLTNISHEIRTPLNAIIGYTDLLTISNINETQKDYLTIILNSANSLLELINEILDFSKIESGSIKLQIERIDLFDLINQLKEITYFKAKNKGLKVQFNISEKTPRFIYTDPVRLKQILMNILSNAVKFTNQGEIEFLLKANQYYAEENTLLLTFSIIDSGIGISKKDQEKIFDAFSQVDSSSNRKFGGAGLGLTISNELLKLLKSKLEVKSELGIGSNFFFSIPVEIEKEYSVISNKKEMNFLEDKKDFKVLVVDDDLINLSLIKTIISKILPNAILFEAINGKEAVQVFVNENPDIVFLDIQMPEMNGHEATAEIRKLESNKKTPIIAVTAGVTHGSREKCFAYGMDDYTNKPVTKTKLEQLINKWLLSSNE